MNNMLTGTVVNGAGGAGDLSAALSGGAAARTLGKDDFLNLLVTQLQHQDPLKPMDNTEFIAQLAQFSTVEGITNMKGSLETIGNYMLSMNNYNASGLVGKKVKANGNGITLPENGSAGINYNLDSEAARVAVSIINEKGAAIRTIEAGPAHTGSNTLSWDGKDLNGNRVAPGRYTFNVAAWAGDNSAIGVRSAMTGIVDRVVYEEGTPYLMVGGTKLSMNDVLEIMLNGI